MSTITRDITITVKRCATILFVLRSNRSIEYVCLYYENYINIFFSLKYRTYATGTGSRLSTKLASTGFKYVISIRMIILNKIFTDLFNDIILVEKYYLYSCTVLITSCW